MAKHDLAPLHPNIYILSGEHWKHSTLEMKCFVTPFNCIYAVFGIFPDHSMLFHVLLHRWAVLWLFPLVRSYSSSSSLFHSFVFRFDGRFRYNIEVRKYLWSHAQKKTDMQISSSHTQKPWNSDERKRAKTC